MHRFARGALEVAVDGDGRAVVTSPEPLSRDEARWLAFVALPAAMTLMPDKPKPRAEGQLPLE